MKQHFASVLTTAIAALALSFTAQSCCSASAEQSQSAASATQVSQTDRSAAVIETIMTRRSVRRYKPQVVGRDTLTTIVRCGINAPNGMNRQPWEVRIVDSRDFIDGITAVARAKDPRMAADSTATTMFRNAYTVIFVGAKDGCELDCGILGENMALSAWSMGLGTCFLGGPIRFIKDTPECQPYLERLGFSEGVELIYALAVGYPDETPEAKPRDESKFRFVE